MTHPNSMLALGTRFKPGVSGNPSGGTKLPEELRGIRSLTKLEVTKVISKYARMTADEIELHIEERKIPILELAFCKMFMQSLKHGDYSRIAFLLDRSLGKVKEVEEDSEEHLEREELKKLSLNELISIVKTNIPEIPEAG